MAFDRAAQLQREDIADDAALIVSELVSNAMLHGGGCTHVSVVGAADGLRIEVRDRLRLPPIMGHAGEESITGRGIRIIEALSAAWGATLEDDGKVVWAEVTGQGTTAADFDQTDLLAMWADELELDSAPRFSIELGDVPTDLLLAAKSHVDGVVREFALASAGASAGLTATVPSHLASLLQAVVERFAEARLAIKHQALEAAHSSAATTRLVLNLPADAAQAAEDYVQALDEVDAYSRAKRLLTIETPAQHRVFRQWYIGELVSQLRAAAAGVPKPAPVPFEQRLLEEIDRLASLQRGHDQAARLYSVAAALATAATPEAVATAVLNEGVAALGASGGGVLLATDADKLEVRGTVGYDEAVVSRLRTESRDAELPAAEALRTGQSVWLESPAERDLRFPQLVGLEADTVALCAVSLEVQGQRLGALRFSFTEARLFDEDERRFVFALAAQTAQALQRAELQRARLEVSRRLQRSLLPPGLPEVPGLDITAIYHPYGDGMDVGGDFYDVWQIEPDRWAIAIGDATGNGPEAAALTAVVRHTLRALAIAEHAPEQVVKALNETLLAGADASRDDRFCTVLYGVIEANPVGGFTVELAGGGHPPAFVRRADGSLDEMVVGGSLVGAFEEFHVGVTTIALAAGDTLLLLTDGVLEARAGGVMFDVDGVRRVLSQTGTAAATAAALEAAVLSHTGGSLGDDMAAVVVIVEEQA